MVNIINSAYSNIEIDGNVVSALPSDFKFRDGMCVILHTEQTVSAGQDMKSVDEEKQYKITVKSYMTKKSTPSFNFMLAWNNDIPMPLMTMVGTIEKETPGMYLMHLHGDILEEQTQFCLCCGKPITNPVSQYFGMGPICGQHNYVNPFDSVEELKQAVSEYRKKLNNIKWDGWVIKSAITEMQEL